MHYSSKINYHVNFPVNGLDMRPFLDKGWYVNICVSEAVTIAITSCFEKLLQGKTI